MQLQTTQLDGRGTFQIQINGPWVFENNYTIFVQETLNLIGTQKRAPWSTKSSRNFQEVPIGKRIHHFSSIYHDLLIKEIEEVQYLHFYERWC